MHDTNDALIGPSRKRRWYQPLAWPGMLLLAWLLFELTADPVPCVVVACAKFGWNDLLTALWLRRVDSRPARGKTCFWFYVASALWKVSFTAFIAMFVIILVHVLGLQGQPRPADPPAEFVAVASESMVGFACSTLTTLLAILVAWRHGVRVWVDGGIHEARRGGVWPPVQFCRANRAIRLTITALTIALLFVAFPTILAVLVALAPLVKEHEESATVILMVAMPLGMCVLAGTILVLNDWVARNVVAVTPQQCWPDEIES